MSGRTSQELPRTQAFILAGGEGERLHPLTLSRPKPAVSFGGVFRIIDFTLFNCLHSGVHQVSLLTQHRHEDLHRYVRGTWSKSWKAASNAPLRFLPPTSGKRYRGTADAVFQNVELLDSERPDFVLVLAGDHVYEMDYTTLIQRHAETNADLTIATVEDSIDNASRFGVVEVDSDLKITSFEEKPPSPRPLPSRPSMVLVNMGVYVFKRNALSRALRLHSDLGPRYDFGRDIIPSLIQGDRTYAYDFRAADQTSPGYWRDIGTLESYYGANMDLVRGDLPLDLDRPHELSRSAGKARLHGSCRITGTVLSPCVQIDENVTVEDSIVMPAVRIGEGAHLRKAIVDEGVDIPPGFHAGFDPEYDRSHHTVTETGVVVISQTVSDTKPTVVSFVLPDINKRARKPLRHKQGVRAMT